HDFFINNSLIKNLIYDSSLFDNHTLHLYPDSAIYNIRLEPLVETNWTDTSQWLINATNEKEATFKAELFINKMKIIHFAKINGFTPCYLDQDSVDELVNWDAEKYRQDLLK
ncbi:uncharacterized protein METZ01_LOCUS327361, partial [marine metagenome]